MYLVLQRYLVFTLAGLLVTLAAFHGARYFQRPDLFPGDRIEQRTCRVCGGSGMDKDLAEQVPELGNGCRACRSEGKVYVLIPGPERPTRIAGVAIDGQWDSPFATADSYRPFPELNADPEAHRRRAHTLAGVSVRLIRSGGEDVELTSNEFGIFNFKLKPGRYTLTATADGRETVAGEFEVEPLTEPVWLEEANYIHEPSSSAEARSMYGLNLLVSLSPAGAAGGRFGLSEGTP